MQYVPICVMIIIIFAGLGWFIENVLAPFYRQSKEWWAGLEVSERRLVTVVVLLIIIIFTILCLEVSGSI